MNTKIKPFSHVVIAGFGDIGQRIAAIERQKSMNIIGIARSEASQRNMRSAGVEPIQADLAKPASLAPVSWQDSLVYYLVPPPKKGTDDQHVANLIASLSPGTLPSRVVAISTSGVYGDCQGKIITEQQRVNPQADRARRRLDMETRLRRWGKEQQVEIVILRVGGIYSCERLPLDRIRQGVPLLHEHLAPKTNRIHADDLAAICCAAARKGIPDSIYNVSDGCDSNMTEYFLTLADFFKIPRPPLVDWDEAQEKIGEGMLSYLRESRRMNNHKMLNELQITLKYPDLLSGLQDC